MKSRLLVLMCAASTMTFCASVPPKPSHQAMVRGASSSVAVAVVPTEQTQLLKSEPNPEVPRCYCPVCHNSEIRGRCCEATTYCLVCAGMAVFVCVVGCTKHASKTD